MPLQDDYEVRLSSFQGPLDLLLFLVRRAEVDIRDIPIHTIAEQYFAFLKQIDRIDVDLAGEFLVMAATLVEIKSRTLAPRQAGADAGDTPTDGLDAADPRFELVRQLLSYQRYRTAAESLDALRHESARRWPAGGHGGDAPDDADAEESIEIEDAHILDLVEAFERIIAAVDLTRLGDHRVEYDDTPISLHQADIVDRLGRATRREMIGLFLALLELARNQQVEIRQDDPDASVEIALREIPLGADANSQTELQHLSDTDES
jgi:segregation and condensation protein A